MLIYAPSGSYHRVLYFHLQVRLPPLGPVNVPTARLDCSWHARVYFCTGVPLDQRSSLYVYLPDNQCIYPSQNTTWAILATDESNQPGKHPGLDTVGFKGLIHSLSIYLSEFGVGSSPRLRSVGLRTRASKVGYPPATSCTCFFCPAGSPGTFLWLRLQGTWLSKSWLRCTVVSVGPRF